ncbi:3-deoxy-7-phosphoheptulonate synthase [bacterium]|nr:3-deoxy-7-phosphoheptulonate synthase [bacterium]
MIIRMKKDVSEKDIVLVRERIEEVGLTVSISRGANLVIIGVIGDITLIESDRIEELPGVESIMRVSRPYKLVSREFNPLDRVVNVKGVKVGKDNFVFIAGPCAVENKEQMIETAKIVKNVGADMLRGGAFKPRTSPYDFQGLGEEGLKYLNEASLLTGLPTVTEVTGEDKIDLVIKYADVIQIGARNMRSYDLLKKIGQKTKEFKTPILLKRGDNATISEFLNAAEYIAKEGNENIILCLRGIRTFECGKFLRNTADIGVIPILKKETGLPVIFDPSHSGGKRDLVLSYSMAAVAAGADGLIIEAHYQPESARCDGQQSLNADELKNTITLCRKVVKEIKLLPK